MRIRIAVLVLGLSTSLLIAASARAQQSSAIAGAVRDTAGVPVAGVNVEAASPALIEKVRTATTDSKGEYKILDVPVGTYEVTFTAAGFNTVKHTGVELQAAFTATVSPSLMPGSPAEVVIVAASTAQVDSQNSSQQERLTSETSQALPSGQQAMSNVANVTGGMTFATADVGGLSGLLANAGNGATYHGKSGIKRVLDGLRIDDIVGAGSAGYLINPVAIQNTVTETGGGNAESLAAGFTINNIPKAGSNTFRFEASALYTNSSLQGNNLDDQQKALGLTTVNRIVRLYDYSASLGGPILKDRLWFFYADRYWGTTQQRTNIFYDLTEGSAVYTPDLTRPANRYDLARSHSGHFTWQASPRNKFDAHIDPQNNCFCGNNGFLAIESDTVRRFYPNAAYQAGWTSPVTTKLLLEAKVGFVPSSWPMHLEAGVAPGAVSITEASTAFVYNTPVVLNTIQDSNRYNQRFSVAYVTGSHAFKFGISDEEGVQRTLVTNCCGGNNVDYTFLKGVPNQITEYATPYEHIENMNADVGVFAQDQWTVRRLTLNYGLRFDYFNSSVPAQSVAATQFVTARSFPAVSDVPNWKDLSPRVGAAYDLFGTGKTVVKGALGKFMNLQAVAIANANNPLNTSVNSVTRTWNNTNLGLVDGLGNYIPSCDLLNPAANGDCGKISNAAFGGPSINTTYAGDVTQGWGVRDHIWDSSIELQRVLGPAVVIKGGYYRNWGENFYSTDNLAVNPGTDYNPYCITAPPDTRLPGGGGYPICGLFDVVPSKFNLVQNVVEQASHFGTQTYVNDFFNVSFTSRFRQGIRMGGSVDTGRTVSDQCFVVSNPEQAMYNLTSIGAASTATASATNVLPCHAVSPFRANLQVKLNGSYPLPVGLTLSGTFQNLSGPQILANYPAPNSAIAPSLGRNLAACGAQTVCTATASVPLITPGSSYEPRRTQLDLRLTKVFILGPRLRLLGKFDLYNVLNSNSSVTINTTYGPTWLRPTSIVDGRVAEFSGSLTY